MIAHVAQPLNCLHPVPSSTVFVMSSTSTIVDKLIQANPFSNSPLFTHSVTQNLVSLSSYSYHESWSKLIYAGIHHVILHKGKDSLNKPQSDKINTESSIVDVVVYICVFTH